MQAKTIVAVISLVTMVGAAYAAGTSVAENLLRAQNRDTGAVLEQAQRDWALSAEAFGQSAGEARDPLETVALREAAGQDPAETATPGEAAAQDPAVSFAPEVQVAKDLAAEPDARTPAAEPAELRSLMSGGSGEKGYFFRSRGEDYGYGEGYEHEDEDHERSEKREKKEKKEKARFGLFEGAGAFEEDD